MKRLLYLSIFFLQFSRCTCCQHGGNNMQHNVTSRKDTLKVTTYLMEINEPKLDSLIKKIADTVVQLNRQRKQSIMKWDIPILKLHGVQLW